VKFCSNIFIIAKWKRSNLFSGSKNAGIILSDMMLEINMGEILCNLRIDVIFWRPLFVDLIEEKILK
jgi:hypothetical protein